MIIVAIYTFEKKEARKIAQLVNDYLIEYHDAIEIYLYHTGNALLDDLNKKHYDILLFDIYAAQKNQVTLLQNIRNFLPACNLIILADIDDFAVTAFDLGAIHYLKKPIKKEKLYVALKRCLIKHNHESPKEFLEITSNRNKITIDQTHILYFESCEKQITIYTFFHIYQVWIPLNSIERNLNPSNFLRLQRSYIVNIDYILSMQSYKCTLKNGMIISVSRSHYKEILEKYMNR